MTWEGDKVTTTTTNRDILLAGGLFILIFVGVLAGRALFDWGRTHGELAQALRCSESIALVKGQLLEQQRTTRELELKFAPDRRP